MPNNEPRVYEGRTPKTVSTINPNLQYSISKQGAVSVYGLQRFPITLYWSMWCILFAGCPTDTETFWAELNMFVDENKGLLSAGVETSDKTDDKPEVITLNSKDLAAITVAANSIKDTNPGRYAELMTIKTFCDLNKGKVPRTMGIDALNVRLELDKSKTPY